jgi:hypothetical protein
MSDVVENRASAIATHELAATRIAQLFGSQMAHARDLGRVAHSIGLSHTDNPFSAPGSYRALHESWQSGWVMADAGIPP